MRRVLLTSLYNVIFHEHLKMEAKLCMCNLYYYIQIHISKGLKKDIIKTIHKGGWKSKTAPNYYRANQAVETSP